MTLDHTSTVTKWPMTIDGHYRNGATRGSSTLQSMPVPTITSRGGNIAVEVGEKGWGEGGIGRETSGGMDSAAKAHAISYPLLFKTAYLFLLLIHANELAQVQVNVLQRWRLLEG